MQAALVRHVQVLGSYIASSSQVLAGALGRRQGVDSLRIVLKRLAPADQPGSRGYRGRLGSRPLRPHAALSHNAPLPSVPDSRYAKAPLGASHRCRALSGEGNRHCVKGPSLGPGASAVRASRSLARPTRRLPCAPWLTCHGSIERALRALAGVQDIGW